MNGTATLFKLHFEFVYKPTHAPSALSHSNIHA